MLTREHGCGLLLSLSLSLALSLSVCLSVCLFCLSVCLFGMSRGGGVFVERLEEVGTERRLIAERFARIAQQFKRWVVPPAEELEDKSCKNRATRQEPRVDKERSDAVRRATLSPHCDHVTVSPCASPPHARRRQASPAPPRPKCRPTSPEAEHMKLEPASAAKICHVGDREQGG